MHAWIIDAFTDTQFAGNPAGVVLLDAPADPVWMQQLAAELRHSETAFVRPIESGYELRWFTPAVEVDLCGHATLATAHALASSGLDGPFEFSTRSGPLTATIDGDGLIALDFPAKVVQPAEVPDGLLDTLGAGSIEGCYSNGIDWLIELASTSELSALAPNFAALAAIPCRGMVITAVADEGAEYDFGSRFFAPRVGVDEDPVTGSAHCALAPFWAERFGRNVLAAAQLSARGGRLEVEVRGDRVLLRGRAVTVLRGELASTGH